MTQLTATASNYEIVIGIECHAQLDTRSKMFCRCGTDYSGGEPNTHVCPVCMGMPGVLPVLNQQAIEFTIMTGLALHCEIPERAKFDRKNYPYPDLMKGYQISEYDQPLCINGYVDIEVGGETKRIRVQRVHLEEDTARLLHRSDESGESYSLLDVNRAGMALMEIVTEPDARSPEEAIAYLMKLRQTLRYLGVSDANMDEGNFRCEPNLSLRPKGDSKYGSKVELKNLNSFNNALRGMKFEVERQGRILDEGGRVPSETRGWRDDIQETASQRSKEQAHDYRYFPEPDLPPVPVRRELVEELRARLPELPDARRTRFEQDYGLLPYESTLLTETRAKADYFEAIVHAMSVADGVSADQKRIAKTAANWLMGEVSRLLNDSGIDLESEELKLTPDNLAALLVLVGSGKVTGAAAKEVLTAMFESGRDAVSIIAERGLGAIEDESIVGEAVSKVLAANEKAIIDYRAGKLEAVKFLVGQVMRETRGRANVAEVQALLQAELDRAG